MPNIIVNGFDSSTDKKKLLELRDALEEECLRIKDLDVRSRSFVSMPANLLPVDKNTKVVILVFVRKRGKRTSKMLQRLAEELAETTKIYFPERKVTCYVRPHKKKMGFAVRK